MRDLLGDKSQTRSGLLRGWLRCAIMRIFNVGVFSLSVPWTAPEKGAQKQQVLSEQVVSKHRSIKGMRVISEPSISHRHFGGEMIHFKSGVVAD